MFAVTVHFFHIWPNHRRISNLLGTLTLSYGAASHDYCKSRYLWLPIRFNRTHLRNIFYNFYVFLISGTRSGCDKCFRYKHGTTFEPRRSGMAPGSTKYQRCMLWSGNVLQGILVLPSHIRYQFVSSEILVVHVAFSRSTTCVRTLLENNFFNNELCKIDFN